MKIAFKTNRMRTIILNIFNRIDIWPMVYIFHRVKAYSWTNNRGKKTFKRERVIKAAAISMDNYRKHYT